MARRKTYSRRNKSRKGSSGMSTTSKVEKALNTRGVGQAKRIFKSAKKAFDVGDKKNGKALWAVGKQRIKFLKKVHN